MPIQRESNIRYQELLDYVYDNIKAICYNVDTISSKIDSKLKYNTTWTVASATPGSSGRRAGGNPRNLKAVVNDTFLLTPVPFTTVKQQLDEFIASRGLARKPEQIVSFKNIMHFYNNIAAFLSTKLVYLMGTFNTTDGFICYDPTQTNFPEVHTVCPTTSLAYNDEVSHQTDLAYPKSEVLTTVSDILTAINKTSRIHYAKTTLTFTSSSSSSCSSSSSSSSSIFIAYMNI